MAEPAIPLRTAEAVVRDVVRRAAGCVGADVLAVVLAEYDARGPVATPPPERGFACPVGDPGCDAPDDGEWHCHDACTPPHSPTSSTAGAVR